MKISLLPLDKHLYLVANKNQSLNHQELFGITLLSILFACCPYGLVGFDGSVVAPGTNMSFK